MCYDYSLWVQVPVCKLCTWLRVLCLCLQLQIVPFLLKKCGMLHKHMGALGAQYLWSMEMHCFLPTVLFEKSPQIPKLCLKKHLGLNRTMCHLCSGFVSYDLWLFCSTVFLCRTPRKSSNVWRVPFCDYIYSLLGNSFSSPGMCRLLIGNNLLNFNHDVRYMQSYEHLFFINSLMSTLNVRLAFA